MVEKVFLTVLLLSAVYIIADCSVNSPEDVGPCDSGNITLKWNYTEPGNMSSIVWHFTSKTNSITTLILVQAQGSAAVPSNGFNIKHISNGEVVLVNPTSANTGIYRITVTYSTSAPTAIDEINVTVNDPPLNLSFTKTPTGEKTIFNCTASYLGDPKATVYIQVGEEKYNTTTESANVYEDVYCCLKDGSAICLSEPCVHVQRKRTRPETIIPPGIAVGLSSVLIICTIIMIFFERLGKVVVWNLSGADIAVIILDCVVAIIYSLIAGAVSVAKSVGENKYCDADTNCTASFGLGIASMVLAVVGVIVLVVFIKIRKVSDKPKHPNGTENDAASVKVMMKEQNRQQEKTAV